MRRSAVDIHQTYCMIYSSLLNIGLCWFRRKFLLDHRKFQFSKKLNHRYFILGHLFRLVFNKCPFPGHSICKDSANSESENFRTFGLKNLRTWSLDRLTIILNWVKSIVNASNQSLMMWKVQLSPSLRIFLCPRSNLLHLYLLSTIHFSVWSRGC